ncbi:Retinoblastoma-like protein 1 [Stylosanthes scabra]|uniref:RHOMBOID-like protein n=1 Tax=Stylosanthes scabra TaxID=79078 RepID=A0ABU6W3F7_9FABA|nr:Retinoblastoma-like protein 1 [Stylosanthes scabra]
MEGEAAASSEVVYPRVNSRRSRAMVLPVEIDHGTRSKEGEAGTSRIENKELKHFMKWVSWLIPTIVIANVFVFIITMYVNNCPKNSYSCIARILGRFSFEPFNENPLLGPSALTLERMGALDVQKVIHRKQVWRLITCIWLHGGVFHLLANMFGIIVIGIRLEQDFGFVLIGLLYVISGFGGSLVSSLFIQENIAVGASGALFGLLGAMLSELITNWSIYDNKIGALLTLVIVIVINLAMGLLPHVDNFAHIGGFLSGFLLGFVFLIRPQLAWVKQQYALSSSSPNSPLSLKKPKFKKYQCLLWVFSLLLLILGFTLGLFGLLRGVNLNDHCSWCKYLSCLPTSRWPCNTQMHKAASCTFNTAEAQDYQEWNGYLSHKSRQS